MLPLRRCRLIFHAARAPPAPCHFPNAAIAAMPFHVFDIFHTPPFISLAADPAAIDLMPPSAIFADAIAARCAAILLSHMP
jgi:hypothetical protein